MQPEPTEPRIETPIEDANEQSAATEPVEEQDYPEDVHRGLEVDEWDATEQARPVPLDDDYE